MPCYELKQELKHAMPLTKPRRECIGWIIHTVTGGGSARSLLNTDCSSTLGASVYHYTRTHTHTHTHTEELDSSSTRTVPARYVCMYIMLFILYTYTYVYICIYIIYICFICKYIYYVCVYIYRKRDTQGWVCVCVCVCVCVRAGMHSVSVCVMAHRLVSEALIAV